MNASSPPAPAMQEGITAALVAALHAGARERGAGRAIRAIVVDTLPHLDEIGFRPMRRSALRSVRQWKRERGADAGLERCLGVSRAARRRVVSPTRAGSAGPRPAPSSMRTRQLASVRPIVVVVIEAAAATVVFATRAGAGRRPCRASGRASSRASAGSRSSGGPGNRAGTFAAPCARATSRECTSGRGFPPGHSRFLALSAQKAGCTVIAIR